MIINFNQRSIAPSSRSGLQCYRRYGSFKFSRLRRVQNATVVVGLIPRRTPPFATLPILLLLLLLLLPLPPSPAAADEGTFLITRILLKRLA